MHPTLTFQTITQAGADRHGIDARELHKRLDNGTKFADWIKRRIDEYDLQAGRDFFDFSDLGNQKPKGRGAKGNTRCRTECSRAALSVAGSLMHA